MALTAKQRAKLPPSAFVYPSKRAYPAPTAAQARKAGISEAQRQRTLRSARSYAARKDTMGTTGRVNAVTAKRSSGTLRRGKR
jgi:3,4-dihydroxy-2-butanone 4-phosphate synthase